MLLTSNCIPIMCYMVFFLLILLTHPFVPHIMKAVALENVSLFPARHYFRKIIAPHGFSALIFRCSGIRGKSGVIMKGAVFP